MDTKKPPRKLKLTSEQKARIKEQYTGEYGEQTRLAKKYKVSNTYINHIVGPGRAQRAPPAKIVLPPRCLELNADTLEQCIYGEGHEDKHSFFSDFDVVTTNEEPVVGASISSLTVTQKEPESEPEPEVGYALFFGGGVETNEIDEHDSGFDGG